MSDWSHKKIADRITHKPDPQVDVKVTLWKDSEGHSICVLEPQNDRSHIWVADHRAAIRGGLQERYALQEGFEIYEGQANGLYTPVRVDGHAPHPASVSMSVVEKRANIMLDLDWERQQDLSGHEILDQSNGHER